MKGIPVDRPGLDPPPQSDGRQAWVKWGINRQQEQEGAITLLEEDLAAIWDAGNRAGYHEGLLEASEWGDA